MLTSKRSRFTLIEGVIAVFIIVAIVSVGLVGAVICGNYWYTQSGVLQVLKADHPNVTEIMKTERHVFGKSIITVKENGETRVYKLNTNILWNYKLTEAQQ